MQKVEVREWQGGSAVDLLEFLKRKSRLHLNPGKIVGGAYILDCEPQQVSVLTKLSGIRFAGKALSIRSIGGDMPQTTDIKSVLQGFLQSRYDPQTKLLNLMNIRADPTLNARDFFNTDASFSKILQAILKLAENPFGQVVSVSLEQNNLSGVGDLNSLSIAFPKLLNLSLANNLIATATALNPFKKRFMYLNELVLNGNPISNSQAEMKKVIEFFPRLTRLNGVVVRTEQSLPKLPMPIQQNFFENPDIQSMAQGFIVQFFKFWDSDRNQLLPLYDDLSEFSYHMDTAAPSTRNNFRGAGPASRWINNSRNLTRANSTNITRFLTEKIALGQAAIGQVFQRLPKTVTKLDDTDEFSFEAWQVQNVRQTPDTGVMIAIHGTFGETGPRASRYSFDRYLVVLPAPTGNMLIASDMLIIRNTGNAEILKSNRPDMNAAAAPVAPVDTTQAVTGVTGAPPGASPANPEALVQQLMQQTGLNMQYATQCLQQANMDPQLALSLFQQHRGQLPPEAFI